MMFSAEVVHFVMTNTQNLYWIPFVHFHLLKWSPIQLSCNRCLGWL